MGVAGHRFRTWVHKRASRFAEGSNEELGGEKKRNKGGLGFSSRPAHLGEQSCLSLARIKRTAGRQSKFRRGPQGSVLGCRRAPQHNTCLACARVRIPFPAP